MIGGGRRVGDRICGFQIAEIEKLARDQTALYPPLIEVAEPIGIVRCRQHPVCRFGDLIGPAQPLDAAENVAGILPAFGRNLVKQRLGLAGLVDHRSARFGDGRLDRPETARRPQAGIVVLDIEARIHARLVVGRRDQVAKHFARLRFGIGGEAVLAPSLAQRRLRAGTVALDQERARQHEPALRGARRLASEKLDDGAAVRFLLPERRFRPPPQRRYSRPAWIGGNESRIAREIQIGVIPAQDGPLHKLASDRIGDRAFDVGGLVRPALMHKLERLLDGGQVERRGGGTRRHGEGRPTPYRWRRRRRHGRGAQRYSRWREWRRGPRNVRPCVVDHA